MTPLDHEQAIFSRVPHVIDATWIAIASHFGGLPSSSFEGHAFPGAAAKELAHRARLEADD
jgi:hypothetical protein